MRKIIVLIAIAFISFQAEAQLKLGIKAGISSSDIQASDLVITNRGDIEELGLAIDEANFGFQFGLFLQAKIANFFIQPELLFNSSSVDFAIEDFSKPSTIGEIRNESYQYLDIPVLVGLKAGPLRVGAGPVAHYFLSSSSELFEFGEYDQKFDELTWGWTAGVGLDIGKLHLDARYEGNFTSFGSHMNFFGEQLDFDMNPARFNLQLGISF
ncbi:MAG: porin family protein [Bacteroidota bacterium]